MASDGSTISSGSRIRQFGLYRSIDARTEEFLRLSRKRQIRQGCACAAASTAITVTVVIIIFFVYEFSLNSGINLESTLKSSWFGLMNETSEHSSFDPKITNANIDRTNLKLLPLLITAIKKNAALEKFLDNHPSANAFSLKPDSKENGYEDNSLSRNWLKTPPTKLYAIEYKTSPVVYYKNPTENIEYYTKIRKIRDYQRVFNYVDKMISEKVYTQSSRPMQEDNINTEPMITSNYDSKMIFPKRRKKLANTPKKNTDTKNEIKHDCNCPKKLGILLEAILRGLQNLSPISNHIKSKNPISENETLTVQKTATPDSDLFSRLSQNPFYFTTTIQTENPKSNNSLIPQHSKKRFTFTVDTIAESKYNFTLDNGIDASEPVPDRPVVINDTEKYNKINNNSQLMKLRQSLFNKYKNIFRKKQIIKRLGSIPKTVKTTTKNTLRPIYEYENYEFTPTLKNNPINDSKLDYTTKEIIYFNDIILKNYKKSRAPVKQKKTKSLISPKRATVLDKLVVDNKMTSVKTKKTYGNKTNSKKRISIASTPHSMDFKSVLSTPSHLDKKTFEEQITFDFVKSSSNNIKDEGYNFFTTKNIANLLYVTEKNNYVTSEPNFGYLENTQDDKTVYEIENNHMKNYINKTLETTTIFNKNQHSTDEMESNKNTKFKRVNKTSTYLLIENYENARMRKKLSALKTKLKKDKATLLQKIDKDKINNKTTHRPKITMPLNKISDMVLITLRNGNNIQQKEIITTPRPTTTSTNSITIPTDSVTAPTTSTTIPATSITVRWHTLKEYYSEQNDNKIISSEFDIDKKIQTVHDSDEDTEFSIKEITKPPEATIFKDKNETYYKSQDLTWEDLTNDLMPTWKPMTSYLSASRNPNHYLEHHKNEDKLDDQIEEEFSINNNFYDLNI